MLMDKLREGAQGRIAKIIFWLIIFSFSLAGIGSYLNRPANTDPAQVNGTPITAQALETAYRNERARLEAQLGEQFASLASNPAYLNQLRQEVLDNLISQRLLDQSAADAGMRVGDEQLKVAIRGMAEFHKDGRFDNDRYLAVLRQAGMTPESFRDSLRQDLVRRGLLSGLLGSEFALPSETKQLDQLYQQTRDATLYTLPLSHFEAGIAVSDDELQSYYQEHGARFMSPEVVKLDYVLLDADKLAAKVEPSQQELLDYYDQHQDQFITPERRKVAHILYADKDKQAESKAKATLALLNEGADFAALAKAESADTLSARDGGTLDWFQKGVMDPTFEAAAFGLQKKGELSEVVKSRFGYHIIKLLDTEPETVLPFDKVKDSLVRQVQQEKGRAAFLDLQQQLADVSFENPDSLEQVAETLKLPVEHTDFVTASSQAFPLDNPKVKQQAFSQELRSQNLNSEVIELSDAQSLVLHVMDYKPAAVRPFDEVKELVVQQVKRDKAVAAANAEAQKLLAKLEAGDSIADAVKSLQGKEEKLAGISRQGAKPEPTILSALFKMPKPQNGKPSFTLLDLGSGDQVLVALDGVTEASEPSAMQQALGARQVQTWTQAEYQALLSSLRNDADISYQKLANDAD